jgi:hypothetical protein
MTEPERQAFRRLAASIGADEATVEKVIVENPSTPDALYELEQLCSSYETTLAIAIRGGAKHVDEEFASVFEPPPQAPTPVTLDDLAAKLDSLAVTLGAVLETLQRGRH